MDSKNIITVAIIIIVSALLVGTFIYYGGGRSGIGSDLSVVPIADSGTENLSRELLSALSSLKDLKLNTDFFKDKAFISLVDHSEELKEEPLGRDNPFLPVQ